MATISSSAASALSSLLASATSGSSSSMMSAATSMPTHPTNNVEIFSLDEHMHFLFVQASIMLLMLVLALNIGGIVHKIDFKYIRETAVYLIMGTTIGIIYVTFTQGNDAKDKAIQLNNSLFYMVLLPPIIFEAGFNLQRLLFLNNTLPILLLAFFGAIYSSVVASCVLYILTWLAGISLTMSQCLIFGAMISSTDPVTVLSLLPEGVDRRLYMLIFGESALNDAVSMILYRFFAELAEEDLTVFAFLRAVWSSALIFVGSIIVGVGTALVFAKMTKHIRPPETPVFQTVMLFVFAYLSYLLAEISGATGVISIFFCGVGMSHYAMNNFSDTALLSIKIMLRAFATMCETFIFLYLGLGISAFGSDRVTYNGWMIIFALVAILISRSHVFLVCGFCNYLEPKVEKRIPMSHQILLWFCGLRGAVCFCLGLQILQNTAFSVETRALIFGTTMIVIVVTVLGMGGMTPVMLKWLKLDGNMASGSGGGGADGGHGGEGRDGHDEGESDVGGFLKRDESVPDGGMRPALMRFLELDQRYIKPWFARQPKTTRKIVDRGISHLMMPKISLKGADASGRRGEMQERGGSRGNDGGVPRGGDSGHGEALFDAHKYSEFETIDEEQPQGREADGKLGGGEAKKDAASTGYRGSATAARSEAVVRSARAEPSNELFAVGDDDDDEDDEDIITREPQPPASQERAADAEGGERRRASKAESSKSEQAQDAEAERSSALDDQDVDEEMDVREGAELKPRDF